MPTEHIKQLPTKRLFHMLLQYVAVRWFILKLRLWSIKKKKEATKPKWKRNQRLSLPFWWKISSSPCSSKPKCEMWSILLPETLSKTQLILLPTSFLVSSRSAGWAKSHAGVIWPKCSVKRGSHSLWRYYKLLSLASSSHFLLHNCNNHAY